jgi:hypothetical protein
MRKDKSKRAGGTGREWIALAERHERELDAAPLLENRSSVHFDDSAMGNEPDYAKQPYDVEEKKAHHDVHVSARQIDTGALVGGSDGALLDEAEAVRIR